MFPAASRTILRREVWCMIKHFKGFPLTSVFLLSSNTILPYNTQYCHSLSLSLLCTSCCHLLSAFPRWGNGRSQFWCHLKQIRYLVDWSLLADISWHDFKSVFLTEKERKHFCHFYVHRIPSYSLNLLGILLCLATCNSDQCSSCAFNTYSMSACFVCMYVCSSWICPCKFSL